MFYSLLNISVFKVDFRYQNLYLQSPRNSLVPQKIDCSLNDFRVSISLLSELRDTSEEQKLARYVSRLKIRFG